MSPRKVSVAKGPPGAYLDRLSDLDRDAIRRQLDRILAHSLFRNSKRYPMLFRYVVEESLEGRSGQLRERTLGIEVFERDPEYDTNLDPVVRVTAGEIRKRIAQYYHDPAHADELRIDLPCGSYVPEFHLNAPEPLLPPRINPNPAPPRRRSLVLPGIGLALAIMLLAVWRTPGGPLESFWGPVWNSAPVVLCVGSSGIPDSAGEYLRSSDAVTLSRLAGLFQEKGKPYSIKIGSQATVDDLRAGPVVLVGGFDNRWTMRLLAQLRYRFVRDATTGIAWIEDHDDPLQREWKVNTAAHNRDLTEDYGIVARVLDPATGPPMVVAAGIGGNGALAAAEVLTNRIHLQQLIARAPRKWGRQNVQAVIATHIVDGRRGPPKILAEYFW